MHIHKVLGTSYQTKNKIVNVNVRILAIDYSILFLKCCFLYKQRILL